MNIIAPEGYISVQHADGKVHAIFGVGVRTRPLWRETPACGASTGVSSDEGGEDALEPRALTCWDCIGIIS